MKKIIYKGTIEENDYNRVKDIDSENYITPYSISSARSHP